ncbi:MAG TPA: ABC transporter permease [Bryobacteraceae bacterium]|nr:ABC transporter permease [Bryobacteraceae bacterium]
METLWQDLKYGFRTLLKSPGFALVAVLSLALGIGANTAIFTLVKAVFLQSLPVFEAHCLAAMVTVDEKYPGVLPVSNPNFEDIRDRQSVFSAMSIHTSTSFTVTSGDAEPETWNAEITGGNFFDVLGVTASLGRTFHSQDTAVPGQSPFVVISYGVFMRRFGGDRSVIGRTVNINRQPFTVIGVMPQGFRGLNALTEPSAWVPLSMARVILARPQALQERRALYFLVSGRLKPGITFEQAQASLQPLAAQLASEFPDANRGRGYQLIPITEATMSADIRQVLQRASLVMISMVGLVLLIACANVAALLLVRARGRSKEFAVRAAIGASSGRIARQLLTESLLLSFAGGLLGLLIAGWSRDFLWSFRPPYIRAAALPMRLDSSVLLFTFGLSVLSGILFGLAPALNAWRRDLAPELKERTTQLVRESRFLGMRSLLVMGQCALSVVALVGAGLFVESLRRAQQVDPGFETQKLLLTRYNLTSAGYKKEQGLDFNRQLVERLTAIPAIRSASFSMINPLQGGGFLREIILDGEPRSGGVMVLSDHVGLRYFETAGIRLIAGREFSPADRENAPRVIIVNESMAKRFWPSESPIGKRVRFGNDGEQREVIGMVADTKFFSLSEKRTPCVYVSLLQEYMSPVTLLVHANENPKMLAGVVRSELQRIDRHMPLGTITTVEEQIGRSLWAQRMMAMLLAVFGVLGLLLAAVGVYGLTAYSVSQRMSEIGIRMALGAAPKNVLLQIVGRGMSLVVPGLLAGIALALASSRFAQSLLFGVGSMHPPIYLGAALLLTLVALVACYVPGRRATRVDPVLALRHE